MAKKQLVMNMIIDGVFYTRGDLIDESKVPENFRRKKFLKEPDPPSQPSDRIEIIETGEIFEQ